MAIVTKHDIYLDDQLKQILDLAVERKRKKFDNLIIIDGGEREGKTTLGKTMGFYYSEELKTKFSLDNLFFDIDEMVEFAINTRDQTIIWDEAALGGLGTQWQDKIQQKLIQMLMVAGKYGHFYIFIIPSFFKLTWYLAVHRSIGLIHVYTPDLLTRGLFTCFNKQQKQWIYSNNKKSGMYTKPTFNGRFTLKNTNKIWNEEAYEAKKDAAIKKYLSEASKGNASPLDRLKHRIVCLLPLKKACEVAGIERRSYFSWKNIGDCKLFGCNVQGSLSVIRKQKGVQDEQ